MPAGPTGKMPVLPLRLFDELAAGFDPVVSRVAGEGKFVTAFREEVCPKPEYGFELALKKTYDLMLFDFSMPMIDGAMLFFLIGKVYNHSVRPRVVPPLLLVTGRGDEKRAQELLQEAGVRGLVPKPFAIERLIEKVKSCLPGVEGAP